MRHLAAEREDRHPPFNLGTTFDLGALYTLGKMTVWNGGSKNKREPGNVVGCAANWSRILSNTDSIISQSDQERDGD